MIVPSAVNGFPLYALLAPSVFTVNVAGLIVIVSVPVTYSKQSSLDTLTFTVLLSDTSFAVISSRFVVHLPSAF